MDRRDFLRRGATLGGAAYLGSRLPWAFAGHGSTDTTVIPQGNMLAAYPDGRDAPIDTVVVLMMENRSVDHYLGWLADDPDYLDVGRHRYGDDFAFDGSRHQVYVDPDGNEVPTYHLTDPAHAAGEENPYRGCGHPDPGHGWDSGRVQYNNGQNDGFLADGSGNDEYAIGYYLENDLQLFPDLARRFTTFDRSFCSVLTSTFPNREYLHSAQSGGISNNALPPEVGGEHTFGFAWDNIWDRLRDQAGMIPRVDAGYFFVDLPTVLLWGPRMLPFMGHIEEYFARCASGTLPRVTFIDPGFTTGLRTDDHPYADIRAGQKLVADYVKAFVDSPHWERGVMFITYDEWGGFFDHVPPPTLPDLFAHEGFGQTGFRVPTFMLSPYAKPGFVDHGVYDHTSILRFLEWRFLGAPPHGPNPTTANPNWWLTPRDRHAANIGASLGAERPNPEYHPMLLPEVPITSAPCSGEEFEGLPVSAPAPDLEQHAFEKALDAGFFEQMGYDVELKPLPTL